ncbi:hypothetical protein CC86DRAFT_451503 [Ophiobolus disseminans]|uniref:Uncharacterized protein n=1 Tax=Ophiobolus disseminans TaxID=1469910 RepID=A0A6A7ANH6_9PLEO|nr:hypothetical protein CC86DRAFT_451503 [Ophiobolus disseminans]
MPETIGEKDSSLALSRLSVSSSRFNTQGQISWTDLATTVFQVTVGILARTSAAGVDPYTIVVGQKLMGYFQMTALGRRQISSALQSLPLYKGIGKILSFGFGVNHIVHVMGNTEEGQMLLLLCASLAECYHPDHAAEVLVEMVRTSRAPESLQPSVMQWRDLLNVSMGILSTTTFPERVEKLVALYPAQLSTQYGNEDYDGRRSGGERTRIMQRGCATPESLATILHAIGKITRGETKSITISGNPNAGWIAAFAEWHFQLSVQIIHARSKSTLYQSPMCKNDFNIVILYEDGIDQEDSALDIANITYRVADVTAAISTKSRDSNTMTVVGRLDWNGALGATFGSDFARLMNMGSAFGGAIGCFSRMLRALRMGEDIVAPGYFNHLNFYSLLAFESCGRAFIANVVGWFPELSDIRNYMEGELKYDTETSLARYMNYITTLKVACQCSLCRHGQRDEDNYCMVTLLETVVKLSQLLSLVDNPTHLKPSRLGLDMFYFQHGTSKLSERNSSGDGRFPRRKDLEPLESAMYVSTYRIYDTLRLFTGRYFPPIDRAGALCGNGLCAYYSAFNRSGGGHISDRITITVGAIESHERAYRGMSDDFVDHTFDILEVSKIPPTATFDDMDIIIRETANELKIRFEFRDPARKSAKVYRSGPDDSIRSFVRKTRFLHCVPSSSEHKSTISDAHIRVQRPGYTCYELGDVNISILHASVVQQWLLIDALETEFLFGEECLDCGLAAAVSIAHHPRRGSRGNNERHEVWILKHVDT